MAQKLARRQFEEPQKVSLRHVFGDEASATNGKDSTQLCQEQPTTLSTTKSTVVALWFRPEHFVADPVQDRDRKMKLTGTPQCLEHDG